jgi:uncharacterized membrane protein
MLFAAANAPLTFQRTLMPRTTMDQALVTGLTVATNNMIVSLVQESIQAAALILAGQAATKRAEETRWGRVAIGADFAAIGAGIAVQRALRQRHREPLMRAATRTSGFWLATSGTAGAIVGALQEGFERSGARRGRSYAIVAPAAGALAVANIRRMRHAARRDADLPPEETRASLGKSLAYGLALEAGLSLFGVAERKFAGVTGRTLAKVLPGNEALWRPVGHAAALGLMGIGLREAFTQVLHRIERVQESADAAFDLAPPHPNVSGSDESLVPFDTLSRAGARYVWMLTMPDDISRVMGEPVDKTPIRAYVGLASADTREDRVDLAIRELERTGAFERSWLLVASPTGTGYVNYAAVSILEMLTRGDCSTIALQYSARPSPLSLDRVKDGRRQMRLLMEALRARLATIPAERRPKLVVFGESLGAWTSQDAFVDDGTQGLVDAGVDHAIWIGTPNFSKWKERVLYDDKPNIDRSSLGVFADIGEWNALPAEERERIRYVMITHYDDGVALFGPALAVQAPAWLGPPDTRPTPVPKGMRWVPSTTFFQVLVDMKNAANVVPGVFAAKGHDYRADLLPFFHAALGLKATPEQLERIHEHLEHREVLRSNWMKHHATTGKSLSATVLERLISDERADGREPNTRVIELVRKIAREEFDAGGAGTVAPST